MHFKTLEHTPIKTISEVFSEAFEDYSVSMQLSEIDMTRKIKAESINLKLSVGAFDDDQLVGFILFGVDTVNGVNTMWDGGTAVLKKYRGQRATQQMFYYILPIVQKNEVKRILLEVLEGNKPAYRIYQNLGFKITRKLLAYKGTPVNKSQSKYEIDVIDVYNADELLNMGAWEPAWQQMNERVAGWDDAITTLAIIIDKRICAYAQIDISRKRIFQFAVEKERRRQGLGTALFACMKELCSSLSVVNVDERSHDAIAFLEAIGMKHFISQYEMEYWV